MGQVSGMMIVASDNWCQSSYMFKYHPHVNLKCYQFSCEGDNPSEKGDLKSQFIHPYIRIGDRGRQCYIRICWGASRDLWICHGENLVTIDDASSIRSNSEKKCGVSGCWIACRSILSLGFLIIASHICALNSLSVLLLGAFYTWKNFSGDGFKKLTKNILEDEKILQVSEVCFIF